MYCHETGACVLEHNNENSDVPFSVEDKNKPLHKNMKASGQIDNEMF
jgi:hypothetical protein